MTKLSAITFNIISALTDQNSIRVSLKHGQKEFNNPEDFNEYCEALKRNSLKITPTKSS